MSFWSIYKRSEFKLTYNISVVFEYICIAIFRVNIELNART